jgi:hypothetical protein
MKRVKTDLTSNLTSKKISLFGSNFELASTADARVAATFSALTRCQTTARCPAHYTNRCMIKMGVGFGGHRAVSYRQTFGPFDPLKRFTVRFITKFHLSGARGVLLAQLG